jgi:hypothetical protein
MNDVTPQLQAAAEGFERLALDERARIAGVMTEAQRALARIPGAEQSLEEIGSQESAYFMALAERVGDSRFEAVLADANLGEGTREAFHAKASAEGGMVPFLKKRLEPTATFSVGSVVCCVSGVVLVVGGGALAVDAVLTADVPLAVLGGALVGAGVGAAILCC